MEVWSYLAYWFYAWRFMGIDKQTTKYKFLCDNVMPVHCFNRQLIAC